MEHVAERRAQLALEVLLGEGEHQPLELAVGGDQQQHPGRLEAESSDDPHDRLPGVDATTVAVESADPVEGRERVEAGHADRACRGIVGDRAADDLVTGGQAPARS